MHPSTRTATRPDLIEAKPLTATGESLGARAVRLARAAAAMHMAEVARLKLDAAARPAWVCVGGAAEPAGGEARPEEAAPVFAEGAD